MQGAGSHFQLESPTVSSCATEGVTLARQRNTTVMNAAQAGRISRRQRQRRKGKPETSRVSNPQEPAGPRRFAGPCCCCCCCCNSTRFAASGTEPATGPCGRPGKCGKCSTRYYTVPVGLCRARLHFADRLRAGTGRCSGSGRRPGWVCWGRPLLSRPRGAVGSGPAAVLAAVDSAAVSAVAWSCGCVVGFGWL